MGTVVVNIEVVQTSELGDRSYIAHDGVSAVVIDPQRDLDRIEAVLADKGLTCTVVLETHVHNDYVTGGYELARRTGARYVLSAADAVDFDRHAVRDGDEVIAGRLRIRAVATPGHTDTHLAYIIDAPSEVPPEPPAVFTGGSLLYGSVGRTDLVDPARTEELTRAQFRSARRLADLLGDDALVFPTHGFGSFCSAGSASSDESSTMGQERARNDALTETDEDTFVTRLVAGLTAYPRYYAHMDARNRQGPGAADLSAPEPVEPDELRKRIAAGQWVVDLRDRTAYAAEHLAGSIGIALGQQFSTYLGWLIPWGTPLTLIGDSADQVADAQRQLVRIGIDRPAGAAVGSPSELAAGDELRSYRRASFADLAAESGTGPMVLDVRRDDERAAGHLPGSIHVPLHSLLERLDEIPDTQLWVHCASGFRAAMATSLLDRAGHDVVLIDADYPPL
ncbi:MAG: MBL fold metallo-hydrolase [Pseudonocardiaceae bacterium]